MAANISIFYIKYYTLNISYVFFFFVCNYLFTFADVPKTINLIFDF